MNVITITIMIVLFNLLNLAFGLYIVVFALGGLVSIWIDMHLGTVGERSTIYRFMEIIRFPFARWFA